MSFESALADRARIHRPAAQGVKIEGRTQFSDSEPGTWFACRLTLPQSPESFDPANVRRRVVIVPTLMYGLDDEDGNEFTVQSTDEIEVRSDDLGAAMWQVTAEPEPFRRKEGILGYQVTMRRIKTVEFDPKVA